MPAFITQQWMLLTPEGDPLPLLAPAAARRGPETVVLTFTLAPGVYLRVSREGLFNRSPAARGPGEDSLKADQPVRVEARLDYTLTALLEVARTDEELAMILAAAPPEESVRQTESYFALTVTQQITPQLRGGYQTVWAD